MKYLKPGDTIGIISPSSPVTASAPGRTERAINFLKNKGFRIKTGNLTGKTDSYRSGSIRERAEELNIMLRDREVSCIMSSIGGMNSNSILPYIDYDAFKRYPKAVIGFSDFTAVLFALYSQTGIQTFYGPALVPSFGELPPFSDMTYGYFEDVVIKKDLPYLYSPPKLWTDEFIDWETQKSSKRGYRNAWITRHSGIAEGRIIIGNLNTFSGFWGSPYFPEIKKGDILFIEDSLKDAATLERSFSLLKVNGVFNRIGGLILGKHERFDDLGSGKKPYEILEEVLGDYAFPLLAEVDCSHTHPMFTIPVGGQVKLDADEQTITLLSHNLQSK